MVALRRALENGEDQAVSWEEFPHHVSEGARTSLANTAFLHLQVCPDLRTSAARVVPSLAVHACFRSVQIGPCDQCACQVWEKTKQNKIIQQINLSHEKN